MPGAGGIDSTTFTLVLLSLGLALAVAVRAKPQWGLIAFVVMLCFAPPWIGITVKIFLTPLTLVAVVLVVALWHGEHIPLRIYDGVMAVVLGIVVVCFIAGYIDLIQTYAVVVGWGIAYLTGRVAGARIDAQYVATCIAIFFAVVAVLAILEFVTSHNFFASLHAGNDAYGRWAPEQFRGGVPRVEGAFGHSIALGGSLALAVPFVWTSKVPGALKGVILFLVGTAAVLTLSRIGMGCTALAIALCLTALRKSVSKVFWGWTVGILLVGLAFAVPFATGVFADAGAEAANSADYRGRITELIPQMDWIGESASSYRDASGQTSHGAFQSIDSAMILTGLNIGILPTIVLLASAVGAIVALVRGYRSAALVAVVAVVPGLTSVAFITQFTTFFWFVVGLAVAQTVRLATPHIGISAQEPPADQALVGGGPARRGDSIDLLPRAERSSHVFGRLPGGGT